MRFKKRVIRSIKLNGEKIPVKPPMVFYYRVKDKWYYEGNIGVK